MDVVVVYIFLIRPHFGFYLLKKGDSVGLVAYNQRLSCLWIYGGGSHLYHSR